jgi:NAD(P)-dependent dehydrogenase (short-subunit alcohol dehydrogenase family)
MLTTFGNGYRAAVFGATGGLGGALTAALANDPACALLYAGGRTPPSVSGRVRPFQFDLADDVSLTSACDVIAADGAPDVVIIATGVLHGPGLQPEKSARHMERPALSQAFVVNTIGPALIAARLLARIPRNRRSVLAVLSARVGSIADNQLGGWHSYRASKAALNMLVRNFAIELARTHPHAVCLALHPGTVDTSLSRPFQAGIAHEIFSPAEAAAKLLAVIDAASPADSGRLLGWDGQAIPY